MDGAQLVSHDYKTVALTTYYTRILGGETPTSWSFDVDELYENTPKAVAEQLVAPFTEVEAKRAVRAMEPESAPRPDGVGPGFYTTAWDEIKRDVLAFLESIHQESAALERINRAWSCSSSKQKGQPPPRPFGRHCCKTAW